MRARAGARARRRERDERARRRLDLRRRATRGRGDDGVKSVCEIETGRGARTRARTTGVTSLERDERKVGGAAEPIGGAPSRGGVDVVDRVRVARRRRKIRATVVHVLAVKHDQGSGGDVQGFGDGEVVRRGVADEFDRASAVVVNDHASRDIGRAGERVQAAVFQRAILEGEPNSDARRWVGVQKG